MQAVPVPAEIRIADALPHDLALAAPPGSALWITVAGNAVDVKAAILAGDSTPRYCNAPNRRMGVETLLVPSAHSGRVTLRILRDDHGGAAGIARVSAHVLPLATNDDRTRLEAVAQDAAACLEFPELDRADAAAAAYAAATMAWKALRQSGPQGLALLHAAGTRYLRHTDWRAAADRSAQAFRLLERDGLAGHAAYALRLEGAALDQLANAADYDLRLRAGTARRAQERLAQAATRFDRLAMPYEAGYALSYRGVSQVEAGDLQQSRRAFLAALERFRKAGDGPAQALALQSLAMGSYEEGRTADAAREFERALALIPPAEEPANYAHTLHNSAMPLRVLGRFEEAIAREWESAEILRGLGDHDGEARALHTAAVILRHVGETERAAELLRIAIRLRGQTGVRREQAISLIDLAELERQASRPKAALKLDLEALELLIASNDRARVLLSLARDYQALGEPDRARARLEAILALELAPAHRFLGRALAELAALESAAGRGLESDRLFARAISIHAANASDVDHARVLERRAEAKLARGNVAGAIADSAAALNLFDAIGAQSLQAEGRAAFRASYRATVELHIAALLAQADAVRARDPARAERLLREAFAAGDRNRAQFLAESNGAVGGAVPNELLAARQQVYELLIGKREQRDRLLDGVDAGGERSEQLAREIESLRARARLLENRLAGAHAGGVARATSDAAALPDALPRGVIVAQYFLGSGRHWLFEARDGRVRVHRLEPRGDAENLARELHQSWRSTGSAARDRLATARRLSRQLFAPLGDELPPGGIWIVPDGALHLVPMAVLAAMAWPRAAPGAATVIPALSTLTPGADAQHGPQHLLAVIADPVYTPDDPRIRAADHAVDGTHPAVTVPASSADGSIRRLPSTAIEARDLVALVGDGQQTLALIGVDASRSQVAHAPLERYRFVHFAVHARADARDPALAMLALSRWTAEGRPLDGALRVYDIARMRFNADLVVLSGCDTALGREIAGEGPIGLSHAFLRSGARAVLATLWQVPDTSTAVLMREFYRQLLREGRPAPVALAIAQAELRSRPRWKDPYFWAGFQLMSIARPDGRNNKDVAGREES